MKAVVAGLKPSRAASNAYVGQSYSVVFGTGVGVMVGVGVGLGTLVGALLGVAVGWAVGEGDAVAVDPADGPALGDDIGLTYGVPGPGEPPPLHATAVTTTANEKSARDTHKGERVARERRWTPGTCCTAAPFSLGIRLSALLNEKIRKGTRDRYVN